MAGEEKDLPPREKTRAEVAKLEVETAVLREEHRRPWLMRVGVPVLATGLATGLCGYLFGDSLLERNRAEIRTEVLKLYFGVDNTTPGKRHQMLSFIDLVLAKGDPDLLAWIAKERPVVESAQQEVQRRIARLDEELSLLKNAGDQQPCPVSSSRSVAPGASTKAPVPQTSARVTSPPPSTVGSKPIMLGGEEIQRLGEEEMRRRQREKELEEEKEKLLNTSMAELPKDRAPGGS